MERIFFKINVEKNELNIINSICEAQNSLTGHQINILRRMSCLENIDNEDLFLFEAKKNILPYKTIYSCNYWLLGKEKTLLGSKFCSFIINGETFYKVKNLFIKEDNNIF